MFNFTQDEDHKKDISGNRTFNILPTWFSSTTFGGMFYFMRVPFVLIEHVTLLNREKELAVFLYMKSKFTNSCLFDFNYSKASSAFGVSRTAAKKYITLFLKNGWCKIHCGNLVFKDTISVAKAEGIITTNPRYDDVWKNKKTKFIKTGSIKENVNEIRVWIIRQKYKGFDFLKKASLDCKYSKPLGRKQRVLFQRKLKMISRYGVSKDTFCNVEERFFIGLKKIGSHISASTSTAYRMMKFASERGRIGYKSGHLEFMRTGLNDDKLLSKSGYFVYRGVLCKRHVNEYYFAF